MDAESQSLWDEQQELIADVQEGARSFGALAIYGAAISVLNVFEGVMARAPREQVVTANPNTALDGMKRFINRLDCADETTLVVAERLSASLLLRSNSREAQWGAKVARAFVLGEFLSFKLSKVEPAYAMRADSASKKLISDLVESSVSEQRDETRNN
jgi:glycerol-3-phosphate O-acyltransferase